MIVTPLANLLLDPQGASKKGRQRPIPWGSEPQQQALDDVKVALLAPPILMLPNWTLAFVLHTDTSAKVGADAALVQIVTDPNSGDHEYMLSPTLVIADHRPTKAALLPNLNA